MEKQFLLLFPLLFLLFTGKSVAQNSNFDDGFEDGDFSANPSWSGDTDQFTVTGLNGNFLLQLQGDADNGGVSYLSTPSGEIVGSWEFFINLGFSPSGSNYTEIFLMSDTADLEGSPNGYALRAGESGSGDVFRLVRYDNGSVAETLLSGDTNISGGGAYRLRVGRTAGGEWSLEVGQGYDGTLAAEGGFHIDSTHTHAEYFGLKATYTSSRASLFYYDFHIQLPPLLPTLVRPIDARTLEVTFNRPLNQATADRQDFAITNGIGNPDSLAFIAEDALRLHYAEPMPSGRYSINIAGIADLSGTEIVAGHSEPFTIFGTYENGDLVINEFAYDPPAGIPEYIELKNSSSKILNLSAWQLGDNANTVVLADAPVVVEPDSFLVISSDTSILREVYGPRAYLEISELPSLNNSGDAIRIHTVSGHTADSLYYSSSWGGADLALERRSSSVAAFYSENWGPSRDLSGGTPGSRNSVLPDTRPPRLTALKIKSADLLALGFDERLDAESAALPEHYAISDIGIRAVSITAPDSLELLLENSLQNTVTYSLRLAGIRDLFGNTILADSSFTYFEISTADSGEVAINEFLFAPPPDISEYIELYNASEKSLNLQGWTLSDSRHRASAITDRKIILPPRSYLVIAPDNTLLDGFPDIPLVLMEEFPALNNSGDQIVIRNGNGLLIDSLRYTSGWGGEETALQRRSLDVSAAYPENWGESPGPDFGTPGVENSVYRDISAPRLSSLQVPSSRTISLTFNERLNPVTANDPSRYRIAGIQIESVTVAGPDSVDISLGTPMENARSYLLNLVGIEDIFANSTSSIDTAFTYYEISKADSGDVFINEFMHDPPAGMAEYIELYNPSIKSLDIRNWTLSDNTGARKRITGGSFIIPPDSFVVLSPDQTLLARDPDIPLVAMGNDFPSLNNSGDHIVVRDDSGILLDSLTYSPGWGGNGSALERRSLSLQATYQSNWAESPTPPGTPGRRNGIGPDLEPPKLIGFSVVDSISLMLTFSEEINANSAGNLGNYALSEGVRFISARFARPDTVYLSLEERLKNNVTYRFATGKIPDLFGNVMADFDTTFTYYRVSEALAEDVFITEFSYDPPSGATEYVEIYNSSGKSLDISGWTLSDNRDLGTLITDTQFILPPQSFAVIAPDNTLLSDFPDILLIEMGNRFPSLNNSGDDLLLRSPAGTLLDSLRYASSWGGFESSLERRAIDVSALYPENWGSSPTISGTPGRPNGILPDTQPPALLRLTASDAAIIELEFSERISSATATGRNNFSISPDRAIGRITTDKNRITLFLDEEMRSGENYDIAVSGLEDLFGNTIEAFTYPVEYLQMAEAVSSDIVINEIRFRSDKGSAPEFIELYNASQKNIDLTGWQLEDGSSRSKITQSALLRPGRYLVLTGSPEFASSLPNGISVSGFPSLNDSGDALFLKTESGSSIDSLRYDSSWITGNALNGSLERRDPEAASNDASNWKAVTIHSGGKENVEYQPDGRPPAMLFAHLTADDKIRLVFDEFISLDSGPEFRVDGHRLEILDFNPFRGHIITLRKENGSVPSSGFAEVTAEKVSDVKGNTGGGRLPLAYPVRPNELVINEIMYNPLRVPDDNRPDQSEYIELRNTTSRALSLEGLYLHDAPDENGNVRPLHPVNTTAKWVPPNAFVLFHASENAGLETSGLSPFPSTESPQENVLLRVDRSTLGLASEHDAIYLADSTGTTVDSVYYDESWQNPNIIDTRGIALERIRPSGPSNDDSNWGSSVNHEGGTPNRENSIYQEQPLPRQKTGISFASNPFTPDNDGENDYLLINYKLDREDYLIRARVYDRYGRLIRELANGTRGGFEGTLTWDGRKEDGSRNRIGIYIVVFQAYDSAGGKDVAFKEAVVLARRLN